MKRKLLLVGTFAYWRALLSGGSIEVDGELVIPGWRWDTVYRSELASREGRARIWHYPSRASQLVENSRRIVHQLVDAGIRLGRWVIGESRSAKTARWFAAAILTILAEILIKAAIAG